jgi:gamma-glutamyltranspeptidase/glutathione hydrolase
VVVNTIPRPPSTAIKSRKTAVKLQEEIFEKKEHNEDAVATKKRQPTNAAQSHLVSTTTPSINHITVEVSNLTLSKAWYRNTLPLRQIDRKIRTAVRGAWFQVTCCFDQDSSSNKNHASCCCQGGYLCQTQIHLLEKPALATGHMESQITGQHIGLDLGNIGPIREKLHLRGIPMTLAPQNGNVHVIFLTDPDDMTWEFTHSQHDSKQNVAVSNATLPADRVGILLHRPSAAQTKTDDGNLIKFAISTGNPLATAAGHAILQAGGSASDATITAMSVMSVVEPYNGGLGGDFMALQYNPWRLASPVSVLNGSGRAPQNGASMKDLRQALVDSVNSNEEIHKRGPLSALTVPGAPAAWCRLHTDTGRLPWSVVLAPAIALASEGFLVSQRTAQVWEQGVQDVISSGKLTDAALQEFLGMYAPLNSGDQRMTPRAGERFYNPALATSLAMLSEHGCTWFYKQAAQEIFTHIGLRGGMPLQMSRWEEHAEDHATWEDPVATNYTKAPDGSRYTVYSAAGNSQGALALLILNVLQQTLPLQDADFEGTTHHHHISAKRAVYREFFRRSVPQERVDDTNFVENIKVEVLDAFHRKETVTASRLDQAQDTEGIVVRDSSGLTLSVLQSLALPFGSGIAVPSLGFTIHGRGYGFSLDEKDEFVHAPGKRPWTTLSPYLVERDGRFWMAASVKGGDRQPCAFTQIFMNMIHHGHSPATSVAHPRFRDGSHNSGPHIIDWDHPAYVPSDLAGVNMADEADKMKNAAERQGYAGVVFRPTQIEDSGFGVAQILIDNTSTELKDPESIALESNIVVVSDLARKPGLALVGSQNSLVTNAVLPEEAKGVVASRDFAVLVSPLHRFISENLKPCSEAEMALIAFEGSGERDLIFQRNRVNIAVHNAWMWTSLLTFSVRMKLLNNTNVDLIRISSPILWKANQYEAIIPSSDHTRFHEKVARGSYGFPIGQLPMIRPDQYTMSLSEDNPRFNILFQSSGVSEHAPIMVDSRQKDWANMFSELQNASANVDHNSSTHVEGSISQALESKGLEFPIVAKTSEAATSGSGVKIVDNMDALTVEVDRRIENHEAFILQESLPGTEEFTIHFVAHYGRILAAECFHSVFNKKKDETPFTSWRTMAAF